MALFARLNRRIGVEPGELLSVDAEAMLGGPEQEVKGGLEENQVRAWFEPQPSPGALLGYVGGIFTPCMHPKRGMPFLPAT